MYSKWLYVIVALCLCFSCKDKELPAQYLSTVSVVRETGQQHAPSETTPLAKPQTLPPATPSQAKMRYHIIVGSFALSEKTKAEKLVQQLRDQEYPASLLPSSQRYRVSIEGFLTESQANTALDKYRKITNRQDIWIYKNEK